jgi:outer membrane protein assembly factor BamD
VGEPTLDDPKRTLAPAVNKENIALFNEAAGKPAAENTTNAATGANEPPRSDAPSDAPVTTGANGTGVGVSIVNAPAGDPNAVVKPVTPGNAAIPAAEGPAAAPELVNEKKPGEGNQTTAAATNGKKKKAPKADLDDESSSRKKKKKGLGKINPF